MKEEEKEKKREREILRIELVQEREPSDTI